MGTKAAEGKIPVVLSLPGTVRIASHCYYTSWCLQARAVSPDPVSLPKVTYPTSPGLTATSLYTFLVRMPTNMYLPARGRGSVREK